MLRLGAGSALVLLLCVLAAHGDSYTLDQLVDEAFRNSKQLRSVEEEIRKAETQINDAYGSALPALGLSMNVSHSFAQFNPYASGETPDYAGMMQGLGASLYPSAYKVDSARAEQLAEYGATVAGTTLQAIAGMIDFTQPPNAATIVLSLNQPIFAQGKVSVGLRIAKAYQTTLLCKHHDEKIKLKAAVTKLFYGALLAQRASSIQQQSVKLAAEAHRLTIVQQAIGKGSEFDTLRSLLHLENARIDSQKAESDLRMVYQTLIMLTGVAANPVGFEVAGELPEATFEMSIDHVLEAVATGNNTIKQLDGTEQIQDNLVRLAKTDFLPLVYAGASLSKIGLFDGLDELGRSGTWGDDRKVYAGATWNIFTGFKRIQKVKQARIEREIFLISKRQAVEGMELAARKAYEQVVISRDRLGPMRGVLTLAEKGNAIARKAYEVGSKTFLDVQNADLELSRARMGYNAALLEFHSALVDLKLLMGEL